MNLVAEELFKTDEGPREASSSFAALRSRPGAELFKGRYTMQTNGSDGELINFSGVAKLTVGWQRTSVMAIQVLSVALTLVSAEGHLEELEARLGLSSQGSAFATRAGEKNIEVVMRAVEFMAAGQALATGFASNSALMSALRFKHQWPRGPEGAAAVQADRVVADSSVVADEASAAVANDFFGQRAAGHCRLDALLHSLLPASGGGSDGDLAGDDRVILAAVAGGQEQAGGIADAFTRAERLDGSFVSPDCGFSLRLSSNIIDVQAFGTKVTHYALWVCLLTIVQIRCYFSQMRYTEDGPCAGRLSITCISVQALYDAYSSFLHLFLTASSQHMVNAFALISILKFVLFALVEVRYALSIWRCRHRDVFLSGWDEVRRRLSKVYSYFYGSLLGGLIVIFNAYEHLDLFVLLFQAFWVPQIVYDVRKGSKAPLQTSFLLGISAARCLEIFYLWGCPDGIFLGDVYPDLPGAPSTRVCIAAAVIHCAQVGLMLSQQVLGPRWFLPWFCLPHIYNYRRVGVEATMFGGDDCVICMGELGDVDLVQQRPVITPCDHRFHKQCLERWMDIKMECPTCRTQLPPMC